MEGQRGICIRYEKTREPVMRTQEFNSIRNIYTHVHFVCNIHEPFRVALRSRNPDYSPIFHIHFFVKLAKSYEKLSTATLRLLFHVLRMTYDPSKYLDFRKFGNLPTPIASESIKLSTNNRILGSKKSDY